jgi:hypothetical protein
MIGFFEKAGDPEAGALFDPYIWGEQGIRTLVEKGLAGKTYGKDLKLILIRFYVEGKYPVNGPDQPKVSRYSTKERAISVGIPVRKESFHEVDTDKRKRFIVDSIRTALTLVEERSRKRKLDIRFEELHEDVEAILSRYLSSVSR